MIRLSEFRTGNLLDRLGVIYNFYAIDALHPHQIWIQDEKNKQPSWSYNEDLKPIKLDILWLINFGFEEIDINGRTIYQNNKLRLSVSNSGNIYYNKILIGTVHRLQNLCFALTGSELQYVA
jgi:hypothetical protein